MTLEGFLRGLLVGLAASLSVLGCLTLAHRHPSLFVQGLMVFHARLGIVLVAVGFAYVVLHLKQTHRGVRVAVRRSPRVPWVALTGLAVFAVVTSLGVTGENRQRINELASLVGLAIVLLLVRSLIRLARERWRLGPLGRNALVGAVGLIAAALLARQFTGMAAVRGILAAGVVAAAAFTIRVWSGRRSSAYATGLVVLSCSAVAVAPAALILSGDLGQVFLVPHVLAAVLFMLLVTAHVGAARGAPERTELARVYAWRGPLLRVALPAATVASLGAVLYASALTGRIDPPVLDASAVVPLDRGFARAIPEACESCHAGIVRTWEGSSHARAAANPVFSALLRDTFERRGGAGARICLGCHAPHAADPTRVAFDDVVASEGYRAGVHCVTCHRLVDPEGTPPENWRDGRFSVRAMSADRFGFLGERSGVGAEAARASFLFGSGSTALVASRFGLHLAAFDRASAPRYCAPCHVQTLAPHFDGQRTDVLQDQFASWSQAEDSLHGQTCLTCHMPRRRLTDAYVGSDHAFRAASTYLARLAGGAEAEAEAVHFLEHGAGGEGARWSSLDARLAAPAEGDPAVVVDFTGSDRIGHSFPNVPSDLVQAWLAVRVVDGDGQVLLDLGSDGPDEAGRLGYTLEDADGKPVRGHDLASVARVRERGRVPVAGTLERSFALPGGALVLPLDVVVEARYRRLDPAEAARLTGAPVDGLPIVTVARVERRLGAGDPSATAGRDQRDGRVDEGPDASTDGSAKVSLDDATLTTGRSGAGSPVSSATSAGSSLR